MERDMELIRTILLKVEADPKFHGELQRAGAASLGIEDHTEVEVIYHLVMLIEAGFLAGNTKMARAGAVVISKLTWEGHEFLDSVRDPETWRKTKAGAQKIGNWSFGLLSDMAKAYAKHLAKEKLGLDLS